MASKKRIERQRVKALEKEGRSLFNRRANKLVFLAGIELGVPLALRNFLDVARAIALRMGWDQQISRKQAAETICRYWDEKHGQDRKADPPAVSADVTAYRKLPREERHAFLRSPEWRKLRYEALRVHGARCQCCGATPVSSGSPMHVDHIKPRWTHPHLRLVLANLQILCEDCNLGKGAWDSTDWRPPTEEQPNELDEAFKRTMQ